jgi:asparagine synthase (glutamine-hydrolysing)
MCGIAGYVYADAKRPASRSLIENMTSCLVHRGPDAGGHSIRRNVALGHRRLSIIDVACGAQPMSSGDGRVTVTFNGEIYNYLELRQELSRAGHQFATTSDTEVLLHGYLEWGIELHSRLNGMWAFGLWDATTETLLVSRDRIGEKPVYYASTGDAFVFASEIKALLAFGISDEPELSVLELYLTLGYLPSPLTFYKSIRKLPPGCCLTVRDGVVTEHRYWDVPAIDEGQMNRDVNGVAESFGALLQDSVRLRMRSDVDFGAFLSGGLDSGTIVSLMSRVSDRPVRTFTVGFADSSIDERSLARDVADRFGTVHNEQVMGHPDLETTLSHVLYHTDEPFGDTSAIPTSSVAMHASAHVKMVLSGDGGDEVLSGYNAYQTEKLARYMAYAPRAAVNGMASAVPFVGRILGPPWKANALHAARLLSLSKANFQERLLKRASWASVSVVRAILSDIGTPQIRLDDFLANFFTRCPWSDPFYQLMYFHLKVSLPEDMLVKVDRMSMAHSLEVRTPFLDHRIVEFMAGVDKDVKLRGFRRKAVLRRTLGHTLPASVTQARKRGFVAPVRHWLADPAVLPEVRKRLLDSGMSWNRHAIDSLLTEHVSGEADHGNFIWMAMTLNRWMAARSRCAVGAA